MNIFKKVMFMFIALGMVLGVLACRNNAGGGDEPVPVVKTLDKLVITGDSVQKIAVEKGTDLTVNPISTKGIKINALYNTGEILSTKQDDFTSDGWSVDFSGIDTNNDGTEDVENETDKTDNGGYTLPIKFSYTHEGKTVSIELFVRVIDSNNFEKIEIVDYSRVKEFDIGDAFDPFGLVVKVVLDSTPGQEDAFEVIDFSDTNKWTFETTADSGSVDTSIENDALPVTVKYTTTSKSATADFPIVVFDGDDVASIEITQQPDKKTYDYDATPITELDLTGLNVKMILKKGNREVIVNDWSNVNQTGSKWTYTGFDSSQETTQEITLTYTTRGGKTYDVKFTVTVSDKITGIKLVSPPNDLEYIIGETFDPTGLEIEVLHLNSGNDFTQTFTDVSQFTGKWELVGWNAGNEAEALALTVRYKNDAGSVIYGECSFNVTIFSISNISITQPTGYDVIYFDGESVENVKNIYLATAGVNLNLKAGSTTRDENYPVTSPIFSNVTLSVVGDVNATGDKFEYKTGNATVTCTISWGSQTRDPSFGLTVKKTYQFHETIEKFGNSLYSTDVDNDEIDYDSVSATVQRVPGGTDSNLKFVTFGDYPQTVAQIDNTIVESGLTHIYDIEARKKTVGGLDMYLGDNGSYYVNIETAKRFESGTQYKFSNGNSTWDGKECWFKVEPIVWRVLDTNYKNAGALLWSVKSIDRIPYFADDNTPDVGNGSGLTGGGKSPRTINEVSVDWKNYQYSTVRAFLRGEYESGDSQRTDVQYFTGTTPAKKFQDPDDTKRGFLQSAFTNVAQGKLVAAEIEPGLYDKIFILSEDELLTPDADYYFKSRAYYNYSGVDLMGLTKQGNAQVQRRKQLTDYTMAKEAKRWSETRKVGDETVSVSYPGGEIWTRTATGSGMRAITGWGSVLGTDTDTGRGAHKAKSVVPAICVDPTALPAF